MNPKRLASFGRGTTWPLASRVSSATSFQTPAKRLFAARIAARSSFSAGGVCASNEAPRTRTAAMTFVILLPSTSLGHRLERHHVDAIERVLPRQHALDLHLPSGIR